MSKRRPPTAGTFARLAVASAVACAALPAIVDLTVGIWPSANTARTTAVITPGPRVMGSLHVEDDEDAGVDRFRFAAGTPFEDGKESPGAAPRSEIEAAIVPADAVPDRVTTGGVPRQDAVPASVTAVPQQEARAAEDAAAPVERPEPVTPAVAPAPAQPEQAAQPVPASQNGAAEAAAPPPAASPEMKPLDQARGADAVPALRDKKPAAEPQPAARRPDVSAGGTSRPKRRSASADDEGSAPKPVWRPENLSNWPD